jgi:CubicO group peptidase (beta-lactamase class C family)
MDALVQEAIEQRVFPSAVCAVLMGGRIRYQGAWGYADPESQTVPDARTLYDLASLTKPVSTATLTLLALEEGKLTLEMPLTRFFGQAKHLQGITVYHLLTHTAGLPAYKPLYREAQGHDALIEAVVQTPLERLPGTGYTYSDLGYILLGAILEQVYGCSQAELFRTRIAEPLGMSSTGYNPPPDWQPRIAPTAHSESRAGQILRGEVHDENAWAMEGVAGHAGLFGSLEDLIRFAQMILRGGRPLLSYYAVQAFLTPQVQVGQQPVGWHTLALFAHPNPLLPRGDLFPPRCVGHSGFTGVLMLFDPQVELAVILLTNHVYYSREKEAYLDYRRRLLNALAAHVGEV